MLIITCRAGESIIVDGGIKIKILGSSKKTKSGFYQACEQVLKRNGRLVYQTGTAIVSGRKPLS